jgi:hypothetical protein
MWQIAMAPRAFTTEAIHYVVVVLIPGHYQIRGAFPDKQDSIG